MGVIHPQYRRLRCQGVALRVHPGFTRPFPLAPWRHDRTDPSTGPALRRQHVKARLRGLFNTRSRKIAAVVVVVALVAAVVWIAWPTPGPTPIATRDLTITAPG